MVCYLSRHSGRGVHMPVVRRSVIESIDIPVPPLETQKKIVRMDLLMQKEQELIERLAEQRKKMITAACLKAARKS